MENTRLQKMLRRAATPESGGAQQKNFFALILYALNVCGAE
jgi:hypothetical protein